jgi:hypothetical protein
MTTLASPESLTEARKIENTVNKQASPEAAWKQLARDMHGNSSDMNSVLAQIAKDDKANGTFVLPSLTIAYHKDQLNEGTSYAKSANPNVAELGKAGVGQAIDSAFNAEKQAYPEINRFAAAMGGAGFDPTSGVNADGSTAAMTNTHKFLQRNARGVDTSKQGQAIEGMNEFLSNAFNPAAHFATTNGIDVAGLKKMQDAMDQAFPKASRTADREAEYEIAGILARLMTYDHVKELKQADVKGSEAVLIRAITNTH